MGVEEESEQPFSGAENEDLSRRMEQAVERERNAIGREIHDLSGNNLTALRINIDRFSKEKDSKTWLEQIDRIIDSMALQLRSLSNLLYPSTLESLGLAREKSGIHRQGSFRTAPLRNRNYLLPCGLRTAEQHRSGG